MAMGQGRVQLCARTISNLASALNACPCTITFTAFLRTITLTSTITFPTLLAGNVVLACIALKSLGLSSNQIQAAVNVRCAHPHHYLQP